MQRRAVTPDAALDGRTKGLPAGVDALAPGAIASRGWNVLREDLPLPLALLKASSLDHNARWMRAFREAAGVALAPHGKTSMSPELFRRQLADGAWGITVATVQQLRVARDAGVARVLMANQLVGRQAIGYVLDELARDPAFEFFAVVDSVDLVDQLAAAARARKAGRPLSLLVECGFAGGRTGCRTVDEAMEVARRIAAAAPPILAFNGKFSARHFLRRATVPYGLLPDRIGETRLFVAPSTSKLARRYWNEEIWMDLLRMAGFTP